ncbi:MAG: hypothetical protein AMXMBFR19_17070 [Chthonomonadaceae bacterium]
MSTNCYVLKNEESGNSAQVVRGDEKVYEFTAGSTSGFTTTYSGVSTQYAGTSLVYNSSLDAFIETFPDGKKMVYDKNQGGSPVRYQIGRVEDASGNRHTFTYGTSPETNLLKNIEVPGGRKVTFAYTAGGSPTSLLDHIEDWGGRRCRPSSSNSSGNGQPRPAASERRRYSPTVVRPMAHDAAISRTLSCRLWRRRMTSRIFLISMGFLDTSRSRTPGGLEAMLGEPRDLAAPLRGGFRICLAFVRNGS